MAQYISKSALIAEIESLRRLTFTNFDEGVNATVEILLKVLDTIEVKEVDLENKIDKELDEEWYGEYINLEKFKRTAKHFFELGLKTQKGK